MGKIGVYGGSFNPIHLGHVHAAEEMAAVLGLDRVLMMPAGIPPHKALPDGSPTAQQRLELVRRSVRGHDRLEACDLELRLEGRSYTVQTLRALQEQYPDDELFLLMGTDMFLCLQDWYQPEEICRLATLVCASRARKDDPQALQKQAEKLRSRFGARVRIVPNHVLEMSSTMVRRMLFFGCGEPYLAPAAMDYIRASRLYGVGRNWRNLPFEQMKEQSLALHKPQRVPHVKGCCETSVRLAQRWGENPALAARAGILHDVTKALDAPEQLRLCEKYGIVLDSFSVEHPKLLHAKTGAAVAKHIFGEDPAVVSAINWHTTGRAGMTRLEKILYIADYCEPNRSFDGVERIRALLDRDLDLALYTGFSMSLEELKREGKPADRHSYEAWLFLKQERNFT